MDLGHPGWRNADGFQTRKQLGDIVLGPCGSTDICGGEGLVTKITDEDKDEKWLKVEFSDGVMCAPEFNFYLLERY